MSRDFIGKVTFQMSDIAEAGRCKNNDCDNGRVVSGSPGCLDAVSMWTILFFRTRAIQAALVCPHNSGQQQCSNVIADGDKTAFP